MSSPHAPLPASLRAQRVLLWAVAVLMWLNAVTTVAAAGGFFGIGAGLPLVLAGAFCAVLARALRGGRRWVRIAVVLVHTAMLLGELGRLQSGDPLALIGLLFPVVGLVLLCLKGTRAHFRPAP
ncbi:hypothetical protein ACFO4E_27025 [Nocardiopsis mangrovi]|uniref:Uncharacterized protein n=1 Tax=Nocardiopsis mangrovi TaxID=1179818 RepID=A0ABV9E355_9ACTN